MNARTVFLTVTILLLLVVASAVTGCSTWHGFGEDVERGGQKIQGE